MIFIQQGGWLAQYEMYNKKKDEGEGKQAS